MFLIGNLLPKIIKIDFNKVIAKIKWCSFFTHMVLLMGRCSAVYRRLQRGCQKFIRLGQLFNEKLA